MTQQPDAAADGADQQVFLTGTVAQRLSLSAAVAPAVNLTAYVKPGGRMLFEETVS